MLGVYYGVWKWFCVNVVLVNWCNVGILVFCVIIVLLLLVLFMGSVKLILFFIRENFSCCRVFSLFVFDVVILVCICDYGVNVFGVRSGVLDVMCMMVLLILKKVFF